MRIGCASADWGKDPVNNVLVPGGANWVRIQTPLMALAAAGHEVQVGAAAAVHKVSKWLGVFDRYGNPLGDPPEVIVLQRWMHADAPQHIANAVAAGQVVVNDIDDWFEGLDPANRAFHSTHPKRNPENNRDHFRHAMAAGSLITASTEYLAARYRQRVRCPVLVLRNAIRGEDFPRQEIRDRSSELLVGWVGAVSWRSGDLETLQGVLGPWLREHGSRFVHHAANVRDPAPSWTLLGLEEDLVEGWKPMVPPQVYGRELLKGFDIGLVPLSDVPFNHAKSWIKGLEYAAAGIPFVAADTVEYRALGAGLIARRARDWRRALDTLADPERRRSERERGLAAAAAQDITVRWVDWEKAYSDALGRA